MTDPVLWTKEETEALVPLIAEAIKMVRNKAKALYPDKGEDAAMVALALLYRGARYALEEHS